MPRKGTTITLTLDNETQRQRLEDLAIEFNAMWGKNPNISELIKMIADGRIHLSKPGDATPKDADHYKAQLESIQSAVNVLSEALVVPGADGEPAARIV